MRVAVEAPLVPVDVGHVDERPFACVAGIGIDGDVADYVNRRMTRFRGPWVYPVAAVRATSATGGGGPRQVRVANLQLLPVELAGLAWDAAPGHAAGHLELAEPLPLEPRAPGEPLAWRELELPALEGAGAAGLPLPPMRREGSVSAALPPTPPY